jgi:hypothetical protein
MCISVAAWGQMGTPTPLPVAEREKAAAEANASGPLSDYPQLIDITASTGIHFQHQSSPEAKYIVESMSGGVALIDYDRDGWPDIYFTNAPSVQMAQHYPAILGCGWSSRPEKFHLQPFTDPYVNLSIHKAPCSHAIASNEGKPSLDVEAPPGYPVGQALHWAASSPSLHADYRNFSTTMG